MTFLATFVGVGKHLDPDIRDLVGATRDAKALHALFLDTIPNSNPVLLADFNASVANIRTALQSAALSDVVDLEAAKASKINKRAFVVGQTCGAPRRIFIIRVIQNDCYVTFWIILKRLH
jgi:hypothetical protein